MLLLELRLTNGFGTSRLRAVETIPFQKTFGSVVAPPSIPVTMGGGARTARPFSVQIRRRARQDDADGERGHTHARALCSSTRYEHQRQYCILVTEPENQKQTHHERHGSRSLLANLAVC